MSQSERFYGKYRGTVVEQGAGDHRGQLRVRIDKMYEDADKMNGGDDPPWALPCLPYGGDKVGMFVVPPLGAFVWVEFEAGDPAWPVWSGCCWPSDAERRWVGNHLPPSAGGADTKLIETAMARIVIDDNQQSPSLTIELKTSPARTITLSNNGIELSDGMNTKVVLRSPSVVVNEGALEVR